MKFFKRAFLFLLAFLMVFVLVSCTAEEPDDEGGEDAAFWDWKALPKAESTGVTLNVFNWGEYMDNEDVKVIAAFEHLYGVRVNYRVFTDNESMYAMISSGAVDYDVIFPSDYMIGKMIKENMLEKLDFNNIPNFKFIDETLRNRLYDPTNEYSVPYTWGTIGIFYNTKYVDEEDLEDGWSLLWNEKYKDRIFMFDNPRDAFGITLNKLGYSMNTINETQWNAAYDELVRQKPLLQQYVMDQVYDKMISEEGWIAPYYAGDGIIMMDEDEGNPDIDYFVPESGTNLFVDAMCIPKGSKNKKVAEMFINFLCQTEVALANAEYIGYSTPQIEAKLLLDSEIADDPAFYPPQEILDKCEIFDTLDNKTNKIQDTLWIKLKQK